VLDLKIETGKVRALVQGSDSSPYEVVISIKAMEKSHWHEIQQQCEGQLKSLQDLLAGKFPKTLAEIFFNEKNGLFPNPQTISFDCSCPDWASMCKHVAATLYGIGARFDEDPSLFFTLRGVDTEDLVAKAIEDSADKLLAKSKMKSANVLEAANLSDIFGIDMDIQPDFSTKREAVPSTGSSKIQGKTPTTPKKGMVGNSGKGPKKQDRPGTATDRVAELICAGIAGINIEELVEKTGYSKTKLYGIVHQLKKLGKIKNRSHGVYMKA
jgi:uncharacterized Zn finger protein